MDQFFKVDVDIDIAIPSYNEENEAIDNITLSNSMHLVGENEVTIKDIIGKVRALEALYDYFDCRNEDPWR